MQGQKVISREYKLMLRPERFIGDEQKLATIANVVWRDVSSTVGGIVVRTQGELSRIKTRRLITFLDTVKKHLENAGYIFRERRDIESRVREVTLKFRHADRYLAQDRSMEASVRKGMRCKFEEDIKTPFVPLYSFATTVAIRDNKPFNDLRDVIRLFPDIAHRVDGADRRLAAINGFTARELVLSGASLQMGESPKVNAECALIVWYDDAGQRDTPVAVELSYRYGHKDEHYRGSVTRRAFQAFNALPAELRKWVDPNRKTKTAFVFG